MSENIVDVINQLMADSTDIQNQAQYYAKLSEQASKRAKIYSEYSLKLSKAVKILCDQAVELARGGNPNIHAASENKLFDVVLVICGPQKINVIKQIRANTSFSLKDAKEIAEFPPKTIISDISKENAVIIQRQFQKVGATVEIRESQPK